MAAEAVMGAAVQVLAEKLIATAGEERGLVGGLNKEVARLKESLEMVNAFLHDASRRQVREESVKLWLEDLQDLAYEADDILDDINYEALRRKVEIRNQMKRKVRFFFSLSNPLVFRSTMAHRIKDLNLKLEKVRSVAHDLHLEKIFENSAISLPPVPETDSVTVDPIFRGRENDMSKIIDMLVQQNEEVLSVIPITGMGGLGKTTLALKIFNDPQIVRHFNQRIWVCVSENLDSNAIFKEMLQLSDVREDSKEAILHKLQEKLKEGNYLLVLDDLWNQEISKWEDFRKSLLGISSTKGNFCLVTTRSTEVASIVKTMDLHQLSEEVLSIIPITGMGGLGKTTLAQLIFNDQQIVECFRQSDSGKSKCKNSDEEVLEGLEPHPNMKSLTVKGFKGDHFAPWIMNRSVGATTNVDKLIEVRLIDCERCEEVPTLGHLPLLKILELDGLISVRSLGHSFYYSNVTSESTSRECSGQQTPPFRALQSFKLRNMAKLVEWIDAPRTMPIDESRADHAFRSLEELTIENCPNIAIVPNHDFPALQTLKIKGVKNGSWLVGMTSNSISSSITTLEIDRVAGVTRVSCNGQRLEGLNISECPDLHSIQFSSEGKLASSSLKCFSVDDCEALTDVMLGDDLDYTSLERFRIINCRNVSVSGLESFERMPRLGRLLISRCPKLGRLLVWGNNCLRHLKDLRLGPLSGEEEEGGDTSSFNRFCEMLQHIHQLQSVRILALYGEPCWDTLPDQLQHLTSSTTIVRLCLWDFGGVEALSEWLGNLSSLEYLQIGRFKSLKELPSKEAMQWLTKLKWLEIYWCPLLAEIKNPKSHLYHSEWPKISHIRYVNIW